MSLKITIPPSPEPGLSSSSADSGASPLVSHRPFSPSSELESKATGFRPISPGPFGCDLVAFEVFVIRLFKDALGDDKNAVNTLLDYPLFKDRTIEVLKEKKEATRRINILCHLARFHINQLEKQDVKNLIKAVGESSYVSSATPKKIQSLYRNLFRYPYSHQKRKFFFSETDSSLEGGPAATINPWRTVEKQNSSTPSASKEPFSYRELLDFASEANETLRPYITAYIKKKFHRLT